MFHIIFELIAFMIISISILIGVAGIIFLTSLPYVLKIPFQIIWLDITIYFVITHFLIEYSFYKTIMLSFNN